MGHRGGRSICRGLSGQAGAKRRRRGSRWEWRRALKSDAPFTPPAAPYFFGCHPGGLLPSRSLSPEAEHQGQMFSLSATITAFAIRSDFFHTITAGIVGDLQHFRRLSLLPENRAASMYRSRKFLVAERAREENRRPRRGIPGIIKQMARRLSTLVKIRSRRLAG